MNSDKQIIASDNELLKRALVLRLTCKKLTSQKIFLNNYLVSKPLLNFICKIELNFTPGKFTYFLIDNYMTSSSFPDGRPYILRYQYANGKKTKTFSKPKLIKS